MSAPRGFGLTEVMLSSALLAIGMAASLSVIRNLEDSYAHQRLLTQALNLSEQTMEGLLVQYADSSQLTPNTTHTGPGYDQTGKPGGTFFTVTWTVNAGVPIADTREIVLTVRWSERSGQKSLVLRTVRT